MRKALDNINNAVLVKKIEGIAVSMNLAQLCALKMNFNFLTELFASGCFYF